MTSNPETAAKVTVENMATGEVEVFKGLITQRDQSFGYHQHFQLTSGQPVQTMTGSGELALTIQYVDVVTTQKGTDS